MAEKIFVGKNVLHVQVFKKNDKRTIYNAVYRDGKKGPYYIKRFNVTTMTRERDYNLTNGTPNSRLCTSLRIQMERQRSSKSLLIQLQRKAISL